MDVSKDPKNANAHSYSQDKTPASNKNKDADKSENVKGKETSQSDKKMSGPKRGGKDEPLTLNIGLNQMKVDEVLDQIMAKTGRNDKVSKEEIAARLKAKKEETKAKKEKKEKKERKRGPRMSGGHSEL